MRYEPRLRKRYLENRSSQVDNPQKNVYTAMVSSKKSSLGWFSSNVNHLSQFVDKLYSLSKIQSISLPRIISGHVGKIEYSTSVE